MADQTVPAAVTTAEAEAAAKRKNIIKYALIGLVVAFAVWFVYKKFIK